MRIACREPFDEGVNLYSSICIREKSKWPSKEFQEHGEDYLYIELQKCGREGWGGGGYIFDPLLKNIDVLHISICLFFNKQKL